MYVLCQGGPGLPWTVVVLKNMNVGSPKKSCQYVWTTWDVPSCPTRSLDLGL